MDLDRDNVALVAVKHGGRRWYSIPLTVAAVAAGGYGGYQIAERTTCSNNYDDCRKAKSIIILFSSLGPAGVGCDLYEKVCRISGSSTLCRYCGNGCAMKRDLVIDAREYSNILRSLAKEFRLPYLRY